MPKGPVGRGCDFCRAQRKKCDLAQPVCSRCQKFGVPCIGAGVQRYRFQAYQAEDRPQLEFGSRVPSTSCPLNRTPSNETTLLTQALVKRLEPISDLQYGFVWIYGPLTAAIPGRLGTNAALDAATSALLSNHFEACMLSQKIEVQSSAEKDYYSALRVLRYILNDPAEAITTETLCAIILLTFCEVRHDGAFACYWSPHGKALLDLLRLSNSVRSFRCLGSRVGVMERFYSWTKGPGDTFEDLLVSTLEMKVVFQSFVNPDVVLTEEEYRSMRQSIPDAGRDLKCAVDLSELMLETRRANVEGTSLAVIMGKADSLQRVSNAIVQDYEERLNHFDWRSYDVDTAIKLHGIYSRAHGFALGLSGLVFCLRKALNPSSDALEADTAEHCGKLFAAIHNAKMYLPFGAWWIDWALASAWCATRDDATRTKCESSMLGCTREPARWRSELRTNLCIIEGRLRLTGWKTGLVVASVYGLDGSQ